jgi:hypothetical protein
VGPELVIVAVTSAAWVFAVAGLLIGIVTTRWKTLFGTVASLASGAGLLNGIGAPSPHQWEAGLIMCVFVAAVSGVVAAIANAIKRGLRAANGQTAV